MNVNKKLKYRRKELGLTMLDVAKKVGVSEATISRWESGDIANMRRDKIVLLANALDVTPSFIMGWEDLSEETGIDSKSEEPLTTRQYTDFTPHEREVITQYRAKPHLQEAVDKLLDVSSERTLPLSDEISKDIAQELESITAAAKRNIPK